MLSDDFLGGVVEGFYGQPWSHSQRLHLYGELAALGLNTYFYAPKDDLKHRAIWRETYRGAELATLRELVQSCDQHGVSFIYGLSPGLDIRFSDEAERNCIKARFDQLRKIGVRHFALLFDDLPGHINDGDRRAYTTLAAAQFEVTNAIYAWACEQSPGARFLFCPTPYCDRMDRAQLGGAGYLDDLGQLLNPQIYVLWTGPEIVPKEIPLASIERLAQRIRRPPVIWDNLFANDYDVRRLYCGPYSGRHREVREAVRGILVNPNNEYPINFVPLRSFAEWLTGEGEWNPRASFLENIAQWLPRFATAGQPLSFDDLLLLADCFYLPHAEGPGGQRLLELIDHLLAQPVDAWGTAHEEFRATNRRIQALFERLTELRDREMFYAWSRRGWELKEELQVLDAALAYKKAGGDIEVGFELGTHLPGTYRGGLLAKMERLIEMDAQGFVRPTKSISPQS
ncbi:MAG: beta-N-acetylglucosaminidase domain-containing protein [Pirellulales bacterium]